MSDNIGVINLENTTTKKWPIASGYTNSIGIDNPTDNIMNELGVHFYRLAQGNYTEDNRFDTTVIDRLADYNVCVVLDLLHVWILWRKRNNKPSDYYVFEHLDEFEEAIEQSVNRIQPHITNKQKFWVSVWNEPNYWVSDKTKSFWKGNEQDFKDTWRTAYNKLRAVLLPEQEIIGPAFSAFYEPHMHSILDWMDSKICYLIIFHFTILVIIWMGIYKTYSLGDIINRSI